MREHFPWILRVLLVVLLWVFVWTAVWLWEIYTTAAVRATRTTYQVLGARR